MLDKDAWVSYTTKVINQRHMQDEYLSKCIVDTVKRSFYLQSNCGDERVVNCETVDQFMAVLEVVRTKCSEDMIAYSNPLWDQKQENQWRCCSPQSGTCQKQQNTLTLLIRKWRLLLMSIVISIHQLGNLNKVFSASMAESVDAPDLKSVDHQGRGSSSLPTRTLPL